MCYFFGSWIAGPQKKKKTIKKPNQQQLFNSPFRVFSHWGISFQSLNHLPSKQDGVGRRAGGRAGC